MENVINKEEILNFFSTFTSLPPCKIRKQKLYFYCEKCKKLTHKNLISLFKRPVFMCFSCDCSSRDFKKILEKRRQTNEERYGDPNWSWLKTEKGKEYAKKHMSSNYFKEKSKATLKEKYGENVENVMDVPEIREKALNNLEKFSQEKYGTKNPLQAKENQDKAHDVLKKKYGVNAAAQIPEVREKISKTTLEKYGAFFNPDKAKNTFLQKYGVDHNFKIKEVREKIKQTSTIKYGYDCIFKSPEYRERIKKVLLEKYGVENAAFIKTYNSWRYEDNLFDSYWEFCYFVYNKLNNINITRNKTEKFELSNGQYFYPDFIVNNKFVEIKSSYVMSIQKNWPLKEECCKLNNIKIISNEEIKFYKNWVKKVFSKKEINFYKELHNENTINKES